MEIFRIFGSVFMKTDEADERLDKMNKKGKKTASMFDGLGAKAGKFALTAGAAIGAAAAAIGVKAVGAVEDLDKAMNGLQTQTGATEEEMAGLEQSLLNIYKNNFGESFEDIGDSMAYVAQTTGQSGEELEKTTQNALMLRDTFDFEVNESVNAANSLMQHFGITSDRAMELMAIGAQNGANKNGDLLDVLNEYAPAFSSLGMSADQFTESLIRGAEQGAFQIDKVGDAVKEFNIRAKDLSDSSADAFESLGFSAQEMFEDFAGGGENADMAFQAVTEKLDALEDPLEKNRIGVALFGTQFEDLEAGALKAFTTMTGEVEKTTGVLESINAIKYDTFGEAMTGIGRQLEVGLLIPIGQMLMPLLNKFANFIQQHMPAIEAFIKVAMQNIKIAFQQTWAFIETHVIPIIDRFRENSGQSFETIKKVIQEVVKFIVDKVLPVLVEYFNFIKDEVVPAVVNAFMEWWPIIAEVIEEAWELIQAIFDKWKILFDFIWPYFKDIVLVAIDKIKVIISGFLKVLKGVIQFITGVLTGDWEKAWTGIKNIFIGIFDTIKGYFKEVIDWIAQKVQWVLDKVDKAKKAAASAKNFVVGGARRVGKAIADNIPFMADGGVINSAGTALVGEAGPELLTLPRGAQVTPLDKAGVGGLNLTIHNPLLLNQEGVDLMMEQVTERMEMLGVT